MSTDNLRDVIRDMLGQQRAVEQKPRMFLTNGETQVLSQLRERADVMAALERGDLDRHSMLHVLADILPVPISVCEKLANKFIAMLNEGSLVNLAPSKKLIEATAQAGGVASNSEVDELGMYGIGDGVDLDEPQGDADAGADQTGDHGDDSETADGGYQSESESESESDDKDDTDVKGQDKTEAEGDDDDDKPAFLKKGDKDEPPKKGDKDDDEEDDADKKAEAIIANWRSKLEASIAEDDLSLANETPDSDKGADYDRLELVPGVDDYSRGPASIALEGEELQPEDPGEGSQGLTPVTPQTDTRDALEADDDEDKDDEDKDDDEKDEGEELQPEDPGEGTPGMATSVASAAKLVVGVGQNEKKKGWSWSNPKDREKYNKNYAPSNSDLGKPEPKKPKRSVEGQNEASDEEPYVDPDCKCPDCSKVRSMGMTMATHPKRKNWGGPRCTGTPGQKSAKASTPGTCAGPLY